jgi:hypothetical protein
MDIKVNDVMTLVKSNMTIIIVIIIIIIVMYLTYTFSENNRIKKKLISLNNTIIYDKPRLSLDYCYFINTEDVNIYKQKKLCDYYICSSNNCFLIGNQVLDYCSLEMIKKVLYFGARYIEIPIYDKENKEDTIPVVYNGINNNQVTLNNIEFESVIKIIEKFAFNKQFIENYRDPLFLFLDIKTTNSKTINKVHDILETYMGGLLDDKGNVNGGYLLGNKYNQINIAKRNICELQEKCIILSNGPHNNSTLSKLITASTDKSYLNRITYNEAVLNNDDLTGPKFKLDSDKIEFKSSNIGEKRDKFSFKDYLEIHDDVNLRLYGINIGDGLFMSGSKNPYNNTGSVMFIINSVTKTKIIFENDVILKNSNMGDTITLEIYDKSLITNKKKSDKLLLEEYNKDNITIVIPDSKFSSVNDNFRNIFYKGCQFVPMNFQSNDVYFKDYFNFFKQKSIVFKPKVLINNFDIPKSVALSSMVPALNPDIILNTDYYFIDKIKNNVKCSIKPFKNSKLRLINEQRNAKFSFNYKYSNSKFNIVKGLNKNSGYISIQHINLNDNTERYLTYSDCSCYVYFTKKPDTKNININYIFNNSASFQPLQPLINEKDYNSFGVIKKVNDVDTLYYLKIRSKFDINNKLFVKNVKEYQVKTFLYGGKTTDNTISNDTVVVLTPKFDPNGEFYPTGDIVVRLDMLDQLNIETFQSESITTTSVSNVPVKEKTIKEVPVIKTLQNFNTPIFSGAVDKPIDYELIWDNKDFMDDFDEELSIWVPKANEGFMAMGCVFVKGYKKPSLNDVVCVSVDYLKETYILSKDENNTYGTPIYYNSKYDLALWDIPEHNYVKANSIVTLAFPDKIVIPNSIEFKMYDFILTEMDYYDRLYLDNDISTKIEKKSTLFNVEFDSIITQSGNDIYDYLMKVENTDGKVISYTKGETINSMCMALPQPYWSSFYESVTNPNVVDEYDKYSKPKIKFEACKTRDYFGTNWNLYNDNTIRLEGNPKGCLTYNGDPNSDISVDVNDENNYLYVANCDSKLKNQRFEMNNNNIKVNTNTTYNPNACLTHGPNDELRLEECGDKKFTVISKWNNSIARVDKCNRIDAETELKDIGAIEQCIDQSYYVVYLDSGFNHRHQEFCSLKKATEEYDKNVSKYPRGLGLIHGGKIIKKTSTVDSDSILQKYILKLVNTVGDCFICKNPSKILCVENSIQDSEYTFFQNDEEKKAISDYCRTLKNDNSFRCSRKYRQKFINNISPSSFCLGYFKEAYYYIHHKENELNIDVSRPPTNSTDLIDNLLGENYDINNYHMFIKGQITKSSDTDKFKIVFDNSMIQGIPKNSIDIYKFSDDIILNYSPKYDDIKIGTKVLAQLENQEPKQLIDKENVKFVYGSNTLNYRDTNKNIKIKGSSVKWMAVVIEKLKNNKVEVMFSVNTYNNTNQNLQDDMRPYSKTNIRKIFNVSDLVLLRKAPLCI